MVSSRLWIQSCLCHGTVGRTKLTRKNKTDIRRNRDAKQREFSKESHNSDCSQGHLHRCHLVGWLYASVYSWALNNTGLNCMCLLIGGFFPPIFFSPWCGAADVVGQQWSFQLQGEFGKLNRGHRTGKHQFSLQSKRKSMPKNAETAAQLQSSHMLAK